MGSVGFHTRPTKTARLKRELTFKIIFLNFKSLFLKKIYFYFKIIVFIF